MLLDAVSHSIFNLLGFRTVERPFFNCPIDLFFLLQGNRPVTLIGFSMGARVIFYCLEELSKRKGILCFALTF